MDEGDFDEGNVQAITDDELQAWTEVLREAKARRVAEDLAAVPFIKAKKTGRGIKATWFEGSKNGRVFKTGKLGLGYYVDAQWAPEPLTTGATDMLRELPPLWPLLWIR